MTIICYYLISIPFALFFAFRQDKGAEGLRVGFLIGQFFLLMAYNVLIDTLTDWELVTAKIVRRINDDLYYQHRLSIMARSAPLTQEQATEDKQLNGEGLSLGVVLYDGPQH